MVRHSDVVATKRTENNRADALRALAQMHQSAYGVAGLDLKKVIISSISVDEVERPNAVVSFTVRPDDDSLVRGRCVMKFTLISGNEWRVSGFHVESLVGGKKGPLIFPFGAGK